MQVQLLVIKDQDVVSVKLAGQTYRFIKNSRGHFVTEMQNEEHIKFISNPRNGPFQPYVSGTTDNVQVVDGKAEGESISDKPKEKESGEVNLGEESNVEDKAATEPLKIEPVDEKKGVPEVEKYGQRIKKQQAKDE